MDRYLEVQGRKKSADAKVDILFDFGSGEASKSSIVPIDDRHLDDGLMKLPKTLRDMLSMLVEVNPDKVNSIATVGFLLMGVETEVIFMDVTVGHSVARASKGHKFYFPVSCPTFIVDFIPLLEMTWKGEKMMEYTIRVLDDRKRKAAVMMLLTEVVNAVRLYQFHIFAPVVKLPFNTKQEKNFIMYQMKTPSKLQKLCSYVIFLLIGQARRVY